MTETLPDRVVIDGPVPRELPLDEYMRLPLLERIELLLRGKVTFYAGEEKLLPTQALAAMQKRDSSS